MKKGDILGHEFMGAVVEVGREVKKVKKGDVKEFQVGPQVGRILISRSSPRQLCRRGKAICKVARDTAAESRGEVIPRQGSSSPWWGTNSHET